MCLEDETQIQGGSVMVINFEDVRKTLRHKNIDVVPSKTEEPTEFNRVIEFRIKGVDGKYKITWWKNVSYLTTPNKAYIPFHYFSISSTWPNRAKLNLQFSYNNQTSCIIPIEYYGEVA